MLKCLSVPVWWTGRPGDRTASHLLLAGTHLPVRLPSIIISVHLEAKSLKITNTSTWFSPEATYRRGVQLHAGLMTTWSHPSHLQYYGVGSARQPAGRRAPRNRYAYLTSLHILPSLCVSSGGFRNFGTLSHLGVISKTEIRFKDLIFISLR